MEIAEIEALLGRVAESDLAGVPVYVVPMSEVPTEYLPTRSIEGWTSAWNDLALRDGIGERYRGRGPCVVVDTDFPPVAMSEEDRRRAVVSIALHELAHVLDYRRPLFSDPVNDRREYRPDLLATVTREGLNEKTDEDRLVGHDVHWCRLAVHLAWRATEAKVPVPPRWVLAYPGFDCLGDLIDIDWTTDCESWAGRPLRSLQDHPPPPKLAGLWRMAAMLFRQSGGKEIS